MSHLNWEQLLNPSRRKPKKFGSEGVGDSGDVRTEIERDYDRILFSTPVRRLADKTQVFPLERNDSVRNRLTHSHEVGNLARSIGTSLVWHHEVASNVAGHQRNLPAILAAVGLAHDLGNPPFGHQGEEAIRTWFASKDGGDEDIFHGLKDAQKYDFLNFDGNAQTFRLVTRLQPIDYEYGLDLTHATLAALLKYPCDAKSVSKGNAATKKSGIFQSERNIADEVWAATGLRKGVRHPLTFIMEACDDIAYSVLDVEDAVKKQIVSFFDVLEFLRHESNDDAEIVNLIDLAKKKHNDYRENGLSPSELNDVSTQRFRVFLIHKMVVDVRETFVNNIEKIEAGDLEQDLISISNSARLCKLLKRFAGENAFRNRSVKELELTGHQVIQQTMDYIWGAVKDFEPETMDEPADPFSAYVYSRISENYRRIFEATDTGLPESYRRLQLVSDMVSGMTDSYALDFFRDLHNRHETNTLRQL